VITADEILALGPCWTRDGYELAGERYNSHAAEETIRQLVGNGVSAAQIAADERLTLPDRRWLLCHYLARGPRRDLPALVQWAAECAQDAVDRVVVAGQMDEDTEAVSRQAIEAAIRWTEERTAAAAAAAVAADAADAAAYAAYAAAADAAAYAAYAGGDTHDSLITLARIIDGGSP